MKIHNPQGIKTVNEPVPGFTNVELKLLSIINIISAITLIIMSTVFISVEKAAMIFLFTAGSSIMFFRKSEENLSLYKALKKLIKFNSSQKVFKYKRLNEYE